MDEGEGENYVSPESNRSPVKPVIEKPLRNVLLQDTIENITNEGGEELLASSNTNMKIDVEVRHSIVSQQPSSIPTTVKTSPVVKRL